MIFSFIKYTQPGWYFNLVPLSRKKFPACLYHPDFTELPAGITIDLDEGYTTLSAQYADAGYRLWHKGVMLTANDKTINSLHHLPKPTLHDEYRFIKKYWGTKWIVFTLLVRLFSFKTSFNEIAAFFAAKKTAQKSLYREIFDWKEYHSFQSALVQSNPLVSVIIPTLNRYDYLKNVLLDLEKQSFKNFDVIIVDQTENFNAAFYKQFELRLNVVRQKEKLLWTARNNAVKESKADYLLFFDDDSRVESGWIAHHLKCIDFFQADISAGVSISVIGGKVPKSYDFFRWADQFDSGNALVKRSVFEKIGLFDLQFNKQSMGDGEFGLRAYLNGLISISNPYAKRVHLKVGSGGLREIGHWDGFRPNKLFAPKPIPSVIYLFKQYFPAELYRNNIYLGILTSNVSYKKKRSSTAMVISVVLTVVKLPLLAIQFRRSLNKANKMLQEGNKIKWL